MTSQSTIICRDYDSTELFKKLESLTNQNNIVDIVQRTSNFVERITKGNSADYIIIYHKA